MTLTIPLIIFIPVIFVACYRYMGLKFRHLLALLVVGLVLAYMLANTSIGPEIQHLLTTISHGGRK
jgi:nucleoside permease NupC